MSRQFSRTAVALAVLASGLLTAWNAPVSAARQAPDTQYLPDAGYSAEAPDAPALVVPAYTDDPDLRLTGTGEAGGTVSVVDRDSGDELCITGVPAEGRWSCLPVENLADGKHLLTPFAVDAAGNRRPGPPAELVVATGLPGRPALSSPAPGETVRVSRPRLVGRADPGSDVMVTAWAGTGADAGRRTVLCGATAALDGSWGCTTNRDLADGEQWLIVTATDRAGNGVSGGFVQVRVAAGGAAPVVEQSPTASAPGVPRPSAASPTRTATARPGPAAATAATAATAAATVSSSAASSAVPRPQSPSPVASRLAAGPTPSAPGSTAASVGPSVAALPALTTVPVVASAMPTATAASTLIPTPTATSATGLGASPAGPPSPDESVEFAEPVEASGATQPAEFVEPAGDAARPLAAPVEAAQAASERPGGTGWRGGLAGLLLVLAGLGLITRRVFARRNGDPRR